MKYLTTLFTLSCGLSLIAGAQAYVCKYDKILNTTQAEQFVDNFDGTVTDIRFALMWSKCSVGQIYKKESNTCTGNATNFPTWSSALLSQDTINQLNGYGYNNWRLPNIKELGTLVERACYEPAIRTEFFPETINGLYWSNTPDNRTNPELKAKVIDMTEGGEFKRNTKNEIHVRHVRPSL